MNAQNFTQKTLEMIQTAKSMAMENNNQYITPEHLLYALVDQDGGLIPSLLGKMGVDCNAVLSELDTAIEGMPKVSGDYDIYLSREAERVMNAAEKSAKSLGDEYLSVEHVMIGIFASPTPAIKRIFDGHGISLISSPPRSGSALRTRASALRSPTAQSSSSSIAALTPCSARVL